MTKIQITGNEFAFNERILMPQLENLQNLIHLFNNLIKFPLKFSMVDKGELSFLTSSQ